MILETQNAESPWCKKKNLVFVENTRFSLLVRETGLEPVRDYHTPLKRARLPIPPLSQSALLFCNGDYYSKGFLRCQEFFRKNSNFSALFWKQTDKKPFGWFLMSIALIPARICGRGFGTVSLRRRAARPLVLRRRGLQSCAPRAEFYHMPLRKARAFQTRFSKVLPPQGSGCKIHGSVQHPFWRCK